MTASNGQAVFGRLLRVLRERARLTQDELGAYWRTHEADAGKGHAYIAQIETGRIRHPKSEYVFYYIAEPLGLSLECAEMTELVSSCYGISRAKPILQDLMQYRWLMEEFLPKLGKPTGVIASMRADIESSDPRQIAAWKAAVRIVQVILRDHDNSDAGA